MCLGQEPTHCHTWHVHFHLSRWRCGQGESNICIIKAGNWYIVMPGENFGDFRQKCQNAQKPRDGKNPQNGQKHLGFWQGPTFLKSGQNFRASKILPSDYGPTFSREAPISKRFLPRELPMVPRLRDARASSFLLACLTLARSKIIYFYCLSTYAQGHGKFGRTPTAEYIFG